jgi:hypothetical protein
VHDARPGSAGRRGRSHIVVIVFIIVLLVEDVLDDDLILRQLRRRLGHAHHTRRPNGRGAR